MFAWYLLIYGSGRFVIEQLRQDSLYLGPIRISQGLSLLLCMAAGGFLLWRRYQHSRRSLTCAHLCFGLWLTRWTFLKLPGVYALVLLISGILAVWMARQNPKALLTLAFAVLLDGLGLALALTGWPVSAGFAAAIHTALCSAALPVGMLALTHNVE